MAQENISSQLNDLLASRDFQAELLDKEGRPTDAENAEIFTFDFVSSSGKNYGTMVVILDTDNEMQVFYGDNLGRSMEGDDKTEFFDFVQHLHKFANMRRWTYSPKNINQVKHTMQGLAAIKEGLFEGYYGTRRISYSGEPTEARLVIQHNRVLGEEDARFRYVESLFIETADSERYRLQFKNLAGGRAMLEHVRQGGRPYDVRGSHITEMVSEIATLSRFNRASAGRVLEGVTAELVTEAQQYYKSLRENLKRLAHTRGYQAYFESWHPAETTLQEELVDSIKTMFVEQTLDSRIEAALPVLARLQQENRMKEADIFESWADHLTEGTWQLPETPEQQSKLQELMSRELIVGPDATNATQQLYDLVGDDVLFDRLEELAARDASANVWDDSEIQARLAELGVQLPTAEPAVDPAVDPAAQQPVQESALANLPRPNKRNQFRSLHKLRKQRGLDEQGVAEDIGDLGYNVVRYYEKTQEVKKLTNWLEKEAGLPRNSPLYFDDVDLVYGNKTIVPSALINPKLTFNDLLTAVVQASKQGMAEATGDEKFDNMMGQMQREPKYPDPQMPPTDVKDLYQWAVKNNKPYHKIFAEWANREGYKSVAPALQRAGDLDTEALDYWTPRVWEIYWGEVRGIDSEMPPEWAKKRIPDELRDYLDTVFDAYDRIVFDWPTEYRQIGQQGVAEGDDPWGDQGRFAGDVKVDIGGAIMKMIQVGDIVKYLGQKAEVVALSKDRKRARITIEKGMGGVTQDVNTNDLKQLGQGVTETALRDKADLVAKRRALQDLSRDPGVDQKAVQQRQQDLEKEAKAKDLAESLLDEFAQGLDGAELAEDAVDDFLARGGEIQQGKFRRPRKSEKTDYGSRHIGTLGGGGKPSKVSGTAANTRVGAKPVVAVEASGCNHTQEGEMCPEHGLAECGMYESQVQESQQHDADLARLKSLALGR